ncbi:MAG: methionine biosynthesis protein MetW [Gammaproteobacteria bacterium]|nr:methionine biosynthesis protein MetW [Gammaproteobacteria bacterium]NNL99695.1 methionine biosynthesis protein MetW [Gammaproteobacteria bacterium]
MTAVPPVTSLRPDQQLIAEWIRPASRVLDLGCGDGTLLATLIEQRAVTGYGLEIDVQNIVACLRQGINVIHADLNAGLADFEDDSFDYAIVTQTLQATRHPVELMTDMLRIAREGIVTFPNMGHWKCRLQLAAGRMPVTRALPSEWYDTDNIHICTIADFEDACAQQNIQILRRTTVDARHRASAAMRLFPNILGEVAIYSVQRGST